MLGLRTLVVTGLMATAGAATAAPGLAIFGDSTGKGDGAQIRWHEQIEALLGDGREITNQSRSRSSLTDIREQVEDAGDLEGTTVIIYDRRNAGESVDDYMSNLAAIIDHAESAEVLILPQVPVSGNREDGLTLPILLEINRRLVEDLPEHTFDLETQQAFLSALAGDETRSDRIHRNEQGQKLEAEFIARWLAEHERH